MHSAKAQGIMIGAVEFRGTAATKNSR